MDDQRSGRVLRALRRKRGWRQIDVAASVGCSQNMISLVERGHLDRASLRLVRRIFAAVDATIAPDVRWRGAAIERLLDDEHAALVARVGDYLTALGWTVQIEVSYSEYGERGSYDLLAFHPQTRAILAIEVKTDLPSAEATLRKLDEKARLAPTIGRERFGWDVASVSRVLVLPATAAARRRVDRHVVLFDHVLPTRTVNLKRWLRRPASRIAGIWFVPLSEGGVVRRPGPQRERVRMSDSRHRKPPVAA